MKTYLHCHLSRLYLMKSLCRILNQESPSYQRNRLFYEQLKMKRALHGQRTKYPRTHYLCHFCSAGWTLRVPTRVSFERSFSIIQGANATREHFEFTNKLQQRLLQNSKTHAQQHIQQHEPGNLIKDLKFLSSQPKKIEIGLFTIYHINQSRWILKYICVEKELM